MPEPKATKNRKHLDIDAVDIEAEASRLESLDARRTQPALHEHDTSWVLTGMRRNEVLGLKWPDERLAGPVPTTDPDTVERRGNNWRNTA